MLGLTLWSKQKMILTFDYNWRNVKDEDIKRYTSSFGKAYIILGSFMFLMALSQIAYGGCYKEVGFILFLMGFLISMVIIIKTQIKYKTGLFNS
jgi:hypothetical protein